MPSIVSQKRSMYSCKCIDLDKCIRGYTHSPPVLDTTLALSFLVTPKHSTGVTQQKWKSCLVFWIAVTYSRSGSWRVLQCVPEDVRREAETLLDRSPGQQGAWLWVYLININTALCCISCRELVYTFMLGSSWLRTETQTYCISERLIKSSLTWARHGATAASN